MAQRTGPERFLASLAKGAGAGVILASALAALCLAGCGGGSAADTSTAKGGDSSLAAAKEEGGGEKPSAAKKGASPPAGGSHSAEAGGGSGSAAAGEGGEKHGPSVAPPKGPTEQAPTPAEIANATVADITLQSPAIPASTEGAGRLPAPYTCDGAGDWPDLRWSGVPADSAELILYVMNAQPVEGKLFVDWAVAGLDPGLGEIQSGQLPKGAVLGTNSFGKRGYEVCPPGAGEIYLFAIYALPRALEPQKGFDARELRRQILDVSGNVGLLPVVYSRG